MTKARATEEPRDRETITRGSVVAARGATPSPTITELSSGFADAQPDSAALRPTAARRSLRLLRPWEVQLISRPLGRSQY